MQMFPIHPDPDSVLLRKTKEQCSQIFIFYVSLNICPSWVFSTKIVTLPYQNSFMYLFAKGILMSLDNSLQTKLTCQKWNWESFVGEGERQGGEQRKMLSSIKIKKKGTGSLLLPPLPSCSFSPKVIQLICKEHAHILRKPKMKEGLLRVSKNIKTK